MSKIRELIESKLDIMCQPEKTITLSELAHEIENAIKDEVMDIDMYEFFDGAEELS